MSGSLLSRLLVLLTITRLVSVKHTKISTAETKEEALALVQQIADQDPDKKLKWEVDFPEQQDDFIPFLNTEVRIEPNGQLTSRLYRKPQQKDITLHNNSCHPESVKINTVKNLYSEACRIS